MAVTKAAADAAALPVWNSLIYEYAAAWLPDRKAPPTNRRNVNDHKSQAKADAKHATKLPSVEMRSTFCRPHVSAKKPHICDDTTIPTNDMELSTPCSVVDKSKSHRICGVMKLRQNASEEADIILRPVSKIRIRWYLPISAKDKKFSNYSWILNLSFYDELTCIFNCLVQRHFIVLRFSNSFTWNNTDLNTSVHFAARISDQKAFHWRLCALFYETGSELRCSGGLTANHLKWAFSYVCSFIYRCKRLGFLAMFLRISLLSW